MKSDEEKSFKRRYDRLKDEIRILADDLRFDGVDKEIDDEPWFSLDNAIYVSNHMEMTDNEQYAKDHWGPGKYHRFMHAPETK